MLLSRQIRRNKSSTNHPHGLCYFYAYTDSDLLFYYSSLVMFPRSFSAQVRNKREVQ